MLIRQYIVVALALSVLGAPLWAAPRRPVITLVYTTAETSTSALVAWNTNIASDSLLQYSTSDPVPADAPRIYEAAQVHAHDIELNGLTPGTLYFFRVTSCAKHGCASATGSSRSRLRPTRHRDALPAARPATNALSGAAGRATPTATSRARSRISGMGMSSGLNPKSRRSSSAHASSASGGTSCAWSCSTA